MGKLKKAVAAVGIAAALYFLPEQGLFALQRHKLHNSKPIITEEQLIDYVLSETKRISPNNTRLILPLMYEYSVAQSFLYDDVSSSHERMYVLEVGGDGAKEYAVRHELYHILAGDCDNFTPTDFPLINKIQYLYWYEVKATLYDLIDKKF